jgi:hypothetical protein
MFQRKSISFDYFLVAQSTEDIGPMNPATQDKPVICSETRTACVTPFAGHAGRRSVQIRRA